MSNITRNPRLRIEVKRSYFKTKCRGSGTNCPVAQGAIAAGLRDVFVDGSTLEGEDKDGNRVCAMLPYKVMSFIRKFDDREIPLSSFKPFVFHVEV